MHLILTYVPDRTEITGVRGTEVNVTRSKSKKMSGVDKIVG